MAHSRGSLIPGPRTRPEPGAAEEAPPNLFRQGADDFSGPYFGHPLFGQGDPLSSRPCAVTLVKRTAQGVGEIGPFAALRNLVGGLPDERLNVRYRNWTIRQIVHHLADSHVNSYVRFQWALTEDRPTTRAAGRPWRTRAPATSARR